MLISEMYGVAPKNALCAAPGEFVAGAECEIEAVRHKKYPNWNAVNDGSLRNEGLEYISVPMTGKDLVIAFDMLHRNLDYFDKEKAYSSRTSTHIHVNCLMMSANQVKQLILLYALFEEFFFHLAKPERRDNIHCVALTDTHLPHLYNRPLEYLVDAWHKYTALNLKRLKDLGTVEFRHLHGTDDVEEFKVWVAVLENLWKLALTQPMNADSLTSNAAIESWFTQIFSPAKTIMDTKVVLKGVISNTLLDVKFAFA